MTVTMTEPVLADLITDERVRALIPAWARNVPLLAALDALREASRLCEQCGGVIPPGVPCYSADGLPYCEGCAPMGRCPRCAGDGAEDVEEDHYGNVRRIYRCDVCRGSGYIA